MLQRTIQKIVRLNAQEQQRLKKCANKCGLSEEAYLRSLLNGLVPKEVPPVDYQGMMRELNAIGRNLHQISARANATGFILADEYENNFNLLMDKVMDIRDAVTKPEVLQNGNHKNMEG